MGIARNVINKITNWFRGSPTKGMTEEAPWYVIPADNKWFMRYAVGQILCDRMNELDLHYPEMPVEARHQIEDFKRALLNE